MDLILTHCLFHNSTSSKLTALHLTKRIIFRLCVILCKIFTIVSTDHDVFRRGGKRLNPNSLWIPIGSVGIDLKELGGQLAKCLKFCPVIEIYADLITQIWASVDMNWGVQLPPPDNSNPAYRPINCQVTMLRLGRHTERRSEDLKAIPISLIYRHLHFINNLGSPLSVLNCIRHVVVCDRQRSKSEDNQRDVNKVSGCICALYIVVIQLVATASELQRDL